MENDSNSGQLKNSNIVVGPWPKSSSVVSDSNLKKSKKTREQIIEEEMSMIDSLAERVMIQLIHTLKENEVDINDKHFIRDIGFMNEVLKSLLFRELGYNHPLSDLIPYIIVPTRTKDKKDVYTKFRGDLVIDLVEYLEGDYEEE